jgi:HlyD family secretion protein
LPQSRYFNDRVEAGQLIAMIDPQETELRVDQDRAQLAGAQASIARTSIEIEQSRVTLREQLRQAELRLAVIRKELGIQPTLTQSSISQARAQWESAIRQRDSLVKVSHPNQRSASARASADAEHSVELSRREYDRQVSLQAQGYVAGRVVESARLQLQLDESRFRTVNEEASRLETQLSLELQRADNEIASLKAAYDRALAGRIQDETKRREYEQAVSAVTAARANLKQIDILRQSRVQGQASANQIRSVLADSMRQLGETQVRAPFAGVVTKRYIEVGDLVTALSTFSPGTSLVRIEDRSVMRVRLEVNEIDTARLREEMRVQVAVDALQKTSVTGRIYSIAPASQAVVSAQAAAGDAVVKYLVEVYLDQAPPEVRSGMSAKCTIIVQNKTGGIRIPIAFLGKDDDGEYVMIPPKNPNSSEKPTRRKVKVGLMTGAHVEILEGLSSGDRIVKPEYKGPPRTGFMSDGGS